MTLDTMTEFLIGTSVNTQIEARSQDPDLAKLVENTKIDGKGKVFEQGFDVVLEHLFFAMRSGNLWRFTLTKKFFDAIKITNDFVDHYVQLALAKQGENKKDKKPGEEQPLLMELAERTQDPIRLRGELLSFLSAGRDTTAELIGWLIFLLARHPHVFKRLRDDIIKGFGTSWDETEITFAKLKQCAYLQACMSETLRICPAVAFGSREAMSDTTLPRGGGSDGTAPVFVKKGTFIQWSQYTMGREPSVWGDDADEFKPERFLGRKNGWEYLRRLRRPEDDPYRANIIAAFNGGPRFCIGQQVALTSAGYAIVRLLQRFDDINNDDPDTVWRAKTAVTK